MFNILKYFFCFELYDQKKKNLKTKEKYDKTGVIKEYIQVYLNGGNPFNMNLFLVTDDYEAIKKKREIKKLLPYI
jgi:hypothetical protein